MKGFGGFREIHTMLTNADPRLAELKVLENITTGPWSEGVCFVDASGQAASIGMPTRLYADLVLTLLEDGYLHTDESDIRRGLDNYGRYKLAAERDYALSRLWSSSVYIRMTVTYRGVRRIDELRDLLSRDRVLDRFGILLDGRYIVSDLIRLLERTDGAAVSIIFADVDNFKAFNSDYGYHAGDAVLRAIFETVKRLLESRGEVYRRGGEEILAVLPYCRLEDSRALAEQIRGGVAASTVMLGEQELHATLSIGVAASPPCDRDGPALEALAGNAVNRAKSEGRNRVIVVQ
jgi:diguanylate cyclase (GGDEF)-like protein